jgi:N,N'-diacetyllegionaminate synthase
MEIIGEAGSNHNGDVDIAIGLVEAAKIAGVDSIKFQFIFADNLYLPEFHENGRYVPNKAHAQRAEEQLTEAEWSQVWQAAAKIGIPISASVFCDTGLELLSRLGAPYVKIASTDLTNVELIQKAAERFPRVIISTGMATIGEIEEAVQALKTSTPSANVDLMHCVSLYPCPLEKSNPGRVRLLREAFSKKTGYSDHTLGVHSALLALAHGATFFEKHFTLNRTQAGFDHANALEPKELEAYVQTLKSARRAMDEPPGRISHEEEETKLRARRGVYAARTLHPGDVLTEKDILYVRPGNGTRNTPSDLLGHTVTSLIEKFDGIEGSKLITKSDRDSNPARLHWESEMIEKGMGNDARAELDI